MLQLNLDLFNMLDVYQKSMALFEFRLLKTLHVMKRSHAENFQREELKFQNPYHQLWKSFFININYVVLKKFRFYKRWKFCHISDNPYNNLIENKFLGH